MGEFTFSWMAATAPGEFHPPWWTARSLPPRFYDPARFSNKTSWLFYSNKPSQINSTWLPLPCVNLGEINSGRHTMYN